MTPLIREYQRRGWRPVLVPHGRKGAVDCGWQDRVVSIEAVERHVATGGNLGIIMGGRSAGLADCDLDCTEVLDLADLYLPPTDAVFGRPAKSR